MEVYFGILIFMLVMAHVLDEAKKDRIKQKLYDEWLKKQQKENTQPE